MYNDQNFWSIYTYLVQKIMQYGKELISSEQSGEEASYIIYMLQGIYKLKCKKRPHLHISTEQMRTVSYQRKIDERSGY